MQINNPTLFVEINKTQFIFLVIKDNDNEKFEIIYKVEVPIQGIDRKKIIDLELVHNIFKNKIYTIEQNLNLVFKEACIVVNNFDCSMINFTGYKRLNGSQLAKENITYILNSLKTKINEIESNKTILHIFNSKCFLDKKKVENIPIGLFGDLYSHELSFFLINSNDYKNLNTIFQKCNLRIKKILSKSFIEGTTFINKNSDPETFIKVEINENDTNIFFFENSALKFFQNFRFGTDLIIKDISIMTKIDEKKLKHFLSSLFFSKKDTKDEFLDENLFEKGQFKKIKKKFITEVAEARIQEFVNLIMLKNVNYSSFLKKELPIFLIIGDNLNLKCFEESFRFYFSKKNYFRLKMVNKLSVDSLYKKANSIVQYGWKKEAVPIINEKKSFISRLFDKIFK